MDTGEFRPQDALEEATRLLAKSLMEFAPISARRHREEVAGFLRAMAARNMRERDMVATLRHECAGSGYHDHDGCSCSDEELINRTASSAEEGLARDILAELQHAREKFPGRNVTFAALVEEVGELATATFEESRDRVRKEAVQVAVMAMRTVLDGDHSFDDWRREKGLDPLTIEVEGDARHG